MKEKKKVLSDLISITEYLENIGEEVTAYNDSLKFSVDTYKSENVKGVYRHKLEGFFTFEALLKVYPNMKIIYVGTSFIDSIHICVMQLSHNVRATGVLNINLIDFPNRTSNENVFITNTYPLKELDKIGVRDLVLGYPNDKMHTLSVELTKLIELRSVKNYENKEDSYKLGLVTYANNRLDIMVKTLTFDSEYEDLDILYDSIDNKFHETLIDKIHSTSKGNIVFNGPPGTGKSFYIRKLIKDYYLKYEALRHDNDYDDGSDEDLDFYDRMILRHGRGVVGKLFVYIPTNLAHLFSDPTFTSMLQDKASDYPKGLVIILEDAEKLLESRDSMGSGDGVSALLNMSDGILNDIISTQFIFTYNTETEHIDKAILRPGRLMAKKTFNKLPKYKANILAEKINIDKRFYSDTSLATVFAELEEKQNNILIEEEIKHGKIGFLND